MELSRRDVLGWISKFLSNTPESDVHHHLLGRQEHSQPAVIQIQWFVVFRFVFIPFPNGEQAKQRLQLCYSFHVVAFSASYFNFWMGTVVQMVLFDRKCYSMVQIANSHLTHIPSLISVYKCILELVFSFFFCKSVTMHNHVATFAIYDLSRTHDKCSECMIKASNSVIMTFPSLSESPFGKFWLTFAPDGEHCVWSGNIDRTKYNPSREHKAYVTIIWVPMVWARFRLGPMTSRFRTSPQL